MASVSGSSTQSAHSSASHKSDILQKRKNTRKPNVGYAQRSLCFIAAQQICYKGDGVKKEKQGTLQSFARPKHCSEARAKDITNRIANFVAQDMRPIRMVEGQVFLKMLAYLELGISNHIFQIST